MLSLFNTLTRAKEEFRPIQPGQAGLYVCGPTVYDHAHIGNLRTNIFADVLHRTLLANGLQVKFVMNVTDVDDKTIKRAQEAGKPLQDVTKLFEQAFMDDLQSLNIIPAETMPHATDEIPGMVKMIQTLLDKGFAYKTDSGDIYFSIAKQEGYGRLAGLDRQQLKQNAGGRLETADEYEKDDARDFALWKAWTEADGDVFWDTGLGKGRPGWHIECSVMSADHLGQPFDLHVGGVDLIFPHHVNEMAQSEAANDKPLANYWLHGEHLLVDNSKMAKSKNNFYSSKDILDQGLTLMAFRYLMLSTHYRSKLNFSWESLQAAQNALNNLYAEISSYGQPGQVIADYGQRFLEAINDDLNTPQGLAILWELVRSKNPPADKLATLLKFDEVLGLRLKDTWSASSVLPDVVQQLVRERDAARASQDFARSDELRVAIESNGYVVEDGPDGTRLKKRH